MDEARAGDVGGLGQCRIQLSPMPKSLRLRTRLNGGRYVPRGSLGSPLVNRLATVPTGWKFDGDPSRSALFEVDLPVLVNVRE